MIDTTNLNNVLGRLPLFLSVKSVLVTMSEDAGHILVLSAKYHVEAARHFYFPYFVQDFDSCLNTCLL